MLEAMKRVIPMEGVENVRDLGGYPARGGSVFAKGKFYRAGALHGLLPTGHQNFNDLGIEYIIDLRSNAEFAQNQDNLNGLNGVKHVHLPMLDHLNSAIAEGTWRFPASMQEMYQELLEHYKKEFLAMFEVFAEAKGSVLFHCTAGKDRTGVSAMLLYGLAGVPEDIIAKDYSYSEKILGIDVNLPQEVPEYVVRTKVEYMMDTIQWLNQTYGGIIGYLTSIGVSEAMQRTICQHVDVPYSK